MDYTCYNMNAYNLHIINTDKFKTITIDVSFRRKIKKEEAPQCLHKGSSLQALYISI